MRDVLRMCRPTNILVVSLLFVCLSFSSLYNHMRNKQELQPKGRMCTTI